MGTSFLSGGWGGGGGGVPHGIMAASEFLAKLVESNCEENNFSVEIFSEIS